MSIVTFLFLMGSIVIGYVQGQSPVGYTKIADQDFIDAGPMTILRQDITTLEACADACNQDAQCQSFRLTSFCTLYRLRRCMTPPVHDNVFPFDKGQVYEKNSPVSIPEGSQITTVCGNYSGAVISSFLINVPNGANVNADRIAFNSNCSQLCSAQTGPKCHSWRTLFTFENNPNTPVDLRCTLYADSIYDVDNSRGFLTVQDGICKRAQSIYAINGAATSLLNCQRTSPGTGADPGAPIATAVVGDQNNGTGGGDSGIITAPGRSPSSESGNASSTAPSSTSSSWMPSSTADPPSSSGRVALTTAPVLVADLNKDGRRASTSAAPSSVPAFLAVFLIMMLAAAL